MVNKAVDCGALHFMLIRINAIAAHPQTPLYALLGMPIYPYQCVSVNDIRVPL